MAGAHDITVEPINNEIWLPNTGGGDGGASAADYVVDMMDRELTGYTIRRLRVDPGTPGKWLQRGPPRVGVTFYQCGP